MYSAQHKKFTRSWIPLLAACLLMGAAGCTLDRIDYDISNVTCDNISMIRQPTNDKEILCAEKDDSGECRQICYKENIINGYCTKDVSDDDNKYIISFKSNSCPAGFLCLTDTNGNYCAKIVCPNGQIVCDSKCISPNSDNQYCGAKGKCDNDNLTDNNFKGRHCRSDELCSEGECKKSCLEGQVLCGNKCIDPMSDPEFCGATGTTGSCESEGTKCESGMKCTGGECAADCLDGQIYCGGKCVDPMNDIIFCGAKGTTKTCEDAGKTCDSGMKCTGGECAAECLEGQIYCGGKCIDPMNDIIFCGAKGTTTTCEDAGKTCDSGMKCTGGECAAECLEGQIYCGGKCIDPMTDIIFCGATGTTSTCEDAGKTCDSGMKCTGGECTVSCLESQVFCGGKCRDPQTDPQFCGATGTTTYCSSIGKTCASGTVCTNGKCAASCLEGQVFCGNKCIDPKTDNNHCGGCNKLCPSGQVCSKGSCSTSCLNTQVLCGGKCIDPKTDNNYCGATAGNCDNKACPSGQVCSEGSCSTSCLASQVLCGGKCIDPKTDNNHCGGCNKPCPSGQVCSNGACSLSCPGGTSNCSGKCLNLSDLHLSSCTACASNYCDTDNNKSNGCESYAKGSDPNNCGACGTKCPSGQACQSGVCTTSCPSGQIVCDGKCIDKLTDNNHCGGCNKPCPSGQVCTNGTCTTTCPSGQIVCGGKCIDPMTDNNYCGSCDVICSDGQLCTNGVCD